MISVLRNGNRKKKREKKINQQTVTESRMCTMCKSKAASDRETEINCGKIVLTKAEGNKNYWKKTKAEKQQTLHELLMRKPQNVCDCLCLALNRVTS